MVWSITLKAFMLFLNDLQMAQRKLDAGSLAATASGSGGGRARSSSQQDVAAAAAVRRNNALPITSFFSRAPQN